MATIHLTLLRPDTAQARRLAALNAPDRGVVAITVRPDTRRPGWIARDLLAALGARGDVSGQPRRDADERQLAPIWLHAHDIDDVIVIGAEALSGDIVQELAEIATLAAANLWLVADHIIPDALTDALEGWPVVPVAPEAFHTRWDSDGAPADVDVPEVTCASHDGLPTVVPEVDFTVFRATARRQLPATAYAAVERRYDDEFTDARMRLGNDRDPLEVLRDALQRCATAAAVTVTVRAIQAAAFTRRVHLRVKLDSLLAHDDHQRVATSEDPETWRLLAAYRLPLRQAVCALTLLGVPMDKQQRARVAELDPTGTTLLTAEQTFTLPAGAAPALRALLLTRLAAGAAPTDPLLADLDGTSPGARAFASIVAAAQRELGIRLVSGQVERAATPTTAWARRRGITTTTIRG